MATAGRILVDNFQFLSAGAELVKATATADQLSFLGSAANPVTLAINVKVDA